LSSCSEGDLRRAMSSEQLRDDTLIAGLGNRFPQPSARPDRT
jgi:hypothetical protein